MGKILSIGPILCASKDLVWYLSMTEINVLCARTMQLFNLKRLLCELQCGLPHSLSVTHYSMWLLVSWAHCCSLVKSSLADSDHLQDWLKKLTLLIPEVCKGEVIALLISACCGRRLTSVPSDHSFQNMLFPAKSKQGLTQFLAILFKK